MALRICFALFVANKAYKTFCRCLVLYSRKIFLITLPLLFKKWVGLLKPLYFVEGKIISHGIALTPQN